VSKWPFPPEGPSSLGYLEDGRPLRAMLRELEFSADGDCPVCANWLDGGKAGEHKPDCRLAALLGQVKP
jgi:hypothetical protein